MRMGNQSFRWQTDFLRRFLKKLCQLFFVTNLSWQCFWVLEEKSQFLTLCCSPKNKIFFLQRPLMKNSSVWFSNRSELLCFFRDRTFWPKKWNWSKVLFTSFEVPMNTKKNTRKERKRLLQMRKRKATSSSSGYSCEQYLAVVFSNLQKCFKNQKLYNPSQLCYNKSYSSNNFEGAVSQDKGVLYWEGMISKKSDKITDALLCDSFVTWVTKMPKRTNSSILYFKLGSHFSSTSELLFPKLKVRIARIRARPSVSVISDNLTSVLEFLIVCNALDILLQGRLTQEESEHARVIFLDVLGEISVIPAWQT